LRIFWGIIEHFLVKGHIQGWPIHNILGLFQRILIPIFSYFHAIFKKYFQ